MKDVPKTEESRKLKPEEHPHQETRRRLGENLAHLNKILFKRGKHLLRQLGPGPLQSPRHTDAPPLNQRYPVIQLTACNLSAILIAQASAVALAIIAVLSGFQDPVATD